MAFKTKTKTRQIVNDRQTLDAKHNNILQSFTENKTNIIDLKHELSKIISIINELNIENSKLPILNLILQNKIWEYDDKKKILEETIDRIENNIDETNYMLKTGKLISNYYKIIDDEKQKTLLHNSHNLNNSSTNIISNIKSNNYIADSNNLNNNYYINNGKKKNIIDWFKPNNDNENTTENYDDNVNTNVNEIDNYNSIGNGNLNINEKLIELDTENSNETQNLSENLNENLTENKPIKLHLENKDTIYEKYMHSIDKNYINIDNSNTTDIFDACENCFIEMQLNNNTGQLICPKCGMIENIIVDSDKPSFKEPPKEMTSFCYKRINHLNEFLAQFQAKETTDIPEDVYNEIIIEIKKERITNMAVITPEKMRILLKKIKKNDYYEHIPYIINQLNGLPAPVISQEIEEIVRGMFKAIQIPFEKYCPQKRKNFLSYNYVMYKFFELLELDEYLDCFQLLKSRTKLHQQDEIWKNICKDLNWEFIKSL
jgi:hypothetical protein